MKTKLAFTVFGAIIMVAMIGSMLSTPQVVLAWHCDSVQVSQNQNGTYHVVASGAAAYWRLVKLPGTVVAGPQRINVFDVALSGGNYQVQAADGVNGPWTTSGCTFTVTATPTPTKTSSPTATRTATAVPWKCYSANVVRKPNGKVDVLVQADHIPWLRLTMGATHPYTLVVAGPQTSITFVDILPVAGMEYQVQGSDSASGPWKTSDCEFTITPSTPTSTRTATNTATATLTATATRTQTATSTATRTATATNTATSTATATRTATATATNTATATATATKTSTTVPPTETPKTPLPPPPSTETPWPTPTGTRPAAPEGGGNSGGTGDDGLLLVGGVFTGLLALIAVAKIRKH